MNAELKRAARLNVITHLLGQIPYKDLTPASLDLPPRQPDEGDEPPSLDRFNLVPQVFPDD